MIKSPIEIERLTYALSVVKQAHATVVEQYRPGMTEKEVGKIAMHVMIEKGDWSIGGHIACGRDKEGMIDTAHHFEGATINRGDYIWLDLCVNYMGYWGDNARIFQVGPVPDRIKKIYDVMYRAFDAGVKVARPGVKAKEVWQAVAKVEKEAGFEPLDMCGHGIGMDIHEPPSLGVWDETVLEPGMVLCVEPAIPGNFRKLGGDGIFHHEDLLVITETGCYAVQGFTRDIIQVPHLID
jgi:Xaa-Pro aminopeptidase